MKDFRPGDLRLRIIMLRQIIILLILVLNLDISLQAQEICNNAVDDDQDGMIDLNDPDCICNQLLPSSLIPNPSFEERTCCPTKNARLDCAVAWIQASAPTTDYVHTCGGYLGNSNIGAVPPLPFPDGQGGVGFRDGQAQIGPNYKEYVGACLTDPMVPGTKYRLDFFVGFRNNIVGSTSLNMAIFGSTRCADLPFGGTSNTVGCPANTINYKVIDEQRVSGSNEWVNVVFEFVATEPWSVIILGPGCTANPFYTYDPYFYLDRLVLAESSVFGVPFDRIEGRICEEGVTLTIEKRDGVTYQWYKDGIALVGETNPGIFIPPNNNAEGMYLCILTNEAGCLYSLSYQLRLPPYYESVSASICEGENYAFGQQILTESGFYERLIEAKDGCDSIIQLDLKVVPKTYADLFDTFCKGDTWAYHQFKTDVAGEFLVTLVNANGCDSLVTVNLEEIPPGTGILLQDTIELNLGENVDLIPISLDPAYSGLKWSGPNGAWLADDPAVYDHIPTRTGYYYLSGVDEYGCPVSDSILVMVRTNRYRLTLPNVFSPNGDHLNDRFEPVFPGSVDLIKSMVIFDRWGNQVFEANHILKGDANRGWDGTFRGQDAVPGVYTYMVEVLFIDGHENSYSGDVTLLR